MGSFYLRSSYHKQAFQKCWELGPNSQYSLACCRDVVRRGEWICPRSLTVWWLLWPGTNLRHPPFQSHTLTTRHCFFNHRKEQLGVGRWSSRSWLSRIQLMLKFHWNQDEFKTKHFLNCFCLTQHCSPTSSILSPQTCDKEVQWIYKIPCPAVRCHVHEYKSLRPWNKRLPWQCCSSVSIN